MLNMNQVIRILNMKSKRTINFLISMLVNTIIFVVCLMGVASLVNAASHKDSLQDSFSPASDISDVYIFRSWQDPSKVVLIMNVYPGQNPADGPVFSAFDDEIVYRLNIDNDMDGNANDVIYEFRFKTDIREIPELPGFPFPYVGSPNLPIIGLQGITALTGEGSEGLRLRQYYSVTEINQHKREKLFEYKKLIAVPPNVGEAVMPDYESLAAQGIHTDNSTGIKVFVGQRAESTYADLGAFFNGLNFGRNPPFMTPEEDADDTVNPFGKNRFANTNVSTIAMEMPIDRLTFDNKPADSTSIPFLGFFASTHKVEKNNHHRKNSVFGSSSSWHGYRKKHNRLRQISRMANPTFNILTTDFELKDRYNQTNPKNDAQYQDLVKFPPFASYLSHIVGLPVPPEPRLGLLGILYKYPGQPLDVDNCNDPCADLLHLILPVPPTLPEQQSRLGALLSPDPAGLPNGRRPHDDVYDITLRAFGGPAYFVARIGDGVNFSEGLPNAGIEDGPGYGEILGNRLDVTANGIVKEFPFLATPHAGK